MALQILLVALVVNGSVNNAVETVNSYFVNSLRVDFAAIQNSSEHLEKLVQAAEHEQGFVVLQIGQVFHKRLNLAA